MPYILCIRSRAARPYRRYKMFLTDTRAVVEGTDAIVIAEYEDDMVAAFHPSSKCVGIYVRDEDDASLLLSVG